jgi:hypothetical protein
MWQPTALCLRSPSGVRMEVDGADCQRRVDRLNSGFAESTHSTPMTDWQASGSTMTAERCWAKSGSSTSLCEAWGGLLLRLLIRSPSRALICAVPLALQSSLGRHTSPNKRVSALYCYRVRRTKCSMNRIALLIIFPALLLSNICIVEMRRR